MLLSLRRDNIVHYENVTLFFSPLLAVTLRHYVERLPEDSQNSLELHIPGGIGSLFRDSNDDKVPADLYSTRRAEPYKTRRGKLRRDGRRNKSISRKMGVVVYRYS